MIAGAANNQLAADAIAVQLAEREILWAPDFVANAGGIINIAVELEPDGLRRRRAPRSACAASPTPCARSSTTPTPTGATPLAAAMEIARRRLAEAGAAAA